MKRNIEFNELLEAIDLMDAEPQYSSDNIVQSDDDEPKTDVISALDRIVTEARASGLNKEFWKATEGDMLFLSEKLDLSSCEILMVGVLAEMGTDVCWQAFGKFLGLSRLRAISFASDAEELKNKKWIRIFRENYGLEAQRFRLSRGVIGALRNNQKYFPEKLESLCERQFVDRLVRFFKEDGEDRSLPLDDKLQWLDELCRANPQLPLCSVYCKLQDSDSGRLLLLAVNDFVAYGGTPAEGLGAPDIDDWFESRGELCMVLGRLRDGSQELFGLEIFEHATDDGLANTTSWRLTSKARAELLGGINPVHVVCMPKKQADRDMRSYSDIAEKQLFYSRDELTQIERIAGIMSKEGFGEVRKRLKESGFRTGICCLLYGAPGTGKTETVLQLARKTCRDIFHVNLSGIRDKFVGESEKNIRRVFKRYRKMCRDCEQVPILLFNEADAVFGRRFENVRSSVEKMDNAIQNIILQEMETFEGILVATMNLTDNLDTAFDRRFLFKVEFKRPGLEARTGIWRSMLPELSADESASLAGEFELSGGQIENIARKCKIEYVVTGIYPDLDKVRSFCKEENINRRHALTRIGF